jgi:parallel beta-helix repeat protein
MSGDDIEDSLNNASRRYTRSTRIDTLRGDTTYFSRFGYFPADYTLEQENFPVWASEDNTGWYGSGLNGDRGSNLQIGGHWDSNFVHAYSFIAQHSGPIDSVKVNWQWDTTVAFTYSGPWPDTAYIGIAIVGDDGSGKPGTDTLGQTSVTDWYTTFPESAGGKEPMLAMQTDALIAGETYHLVFWNKSVDAESCYISINALVMFDTLSPLQPLWSDAELKHQYKTKNGDWNEYGWQDSAWRYTPVMQLVYKDGYHFGSAYYTVHDGYKHFVSGDSAVAQIIQPSVTRVVDSVAVRLEKVDAGGAYDDSVKIVLRDMSGDTLAIATADTVRSVDSAETTTYMFWTGALFNQPATLHKGQTYRLEIRTASATDYRTAPLVNLSQTSSNYGEYTAFNDGWAQYTTSGDAGWIGWDLDGGTNVRSGDLQFYLRTVPQVAKTVPLLLQDSLRGYWTLDELSGDRRDTAKATHLTASSVDLAPGRVSIAAEFPSAGALTASDNANLSFEDQSFTIAGWIYPYDDGAANRYILSKATTNAIPGIEYRFQRITSTNVLRVGVCDGVDLTELSSADAAADSTWTFFVAWFDADRDELAVQLNNGTVTRSTALLTHGPEDTTGTFGIGTVPGTTTTSFRGIIDEVGVWARVLTPDERDTLYNSGNGLAYPWEISLDPKAGLYMADVVQGVLQDSGGMRFDLKAFGAIDDSATDATTEIQAACDAAYAAGGTVFGTGAYYITNTIILRSNADLSAATFWTDQSDITMIVWADSAEELYGSRVLLPRLELNDGSAVTAFPTDDNSIGFKTWNAIHSYFHVPWISNFRTGIRMDAAPDDGTVYNEFHLGMLWNNMRGIWFQPTEDGWVNDNQFTGGQVAHSSALGTTNDVDTLVCVLMDTAATGATKWHIGGNLFFDVGLEDVAAYYQVEIRGGSRNTFEQCRWEVGGSGQSRVRLAMGVDSTMPTYNQFLLGSSAHVIDFDEEIDGDGDPPKGTVWDTYQWVVRRGVYGGAFIGSNDASDNYPVFLAVSKTDTLSDDYVGDDLWGAWISNNISHYKATADAEPRFQIRHTTGALHWGDGSAVIDEDAYIVRNGAGTINLRDTANIISIEDGTGGNPGIEIQSGTYQKIFLDINEGIRIVPSTANIWSTHGINIYEHGGAHLNKFAGFGGGNDTTWNYWFFGGAYDSTWWRLYGTDSAGIKLGLGYNLIPDSMLEVHHGGHFGGGLLVEGEGTFTGETTISDTLHADKSIVIRDDGLRVYRNTDNGDAPIFFEFKSRGSWGSEAAINEADYVHYNDWYGYADGAYQWTGGTRTIVDSITTDTLTARWLLMLKGEDGDVDTTAFYDGVFSAPAFSGDGSALTGITTMELEDWPDTTGVTDDYRLAYNKTGGGYEWVAAGAGGGEANTASNVGTVLDDSVFYQKNGVDLEFLRPEAGTDITITTNDSSFIIASTAGGGPMSGDDIMDSLNNGNRTFTEDVRLKQGRAYYVDATEGADGNDGLSSGNAWKTISKVEGFTFYPGDSILFQRGETWDSLVTVPSGTADAPIVVGAYGTGPKPVFDTTANEAGSFYVDTKSHLIFEDLDIRANHIQTTGYGIRITDCNNITVQRLTVTGKLDSAIFLVHIYDSPNFVVRECSLSSGLYGVYVDGTVGYPGVIEDNRIFDIDRSNASTDWDGVKVGPTADFTGLHIRRNEISEFCEDGIDFYNASNVKVYDNYIHDNTAVKTSDNSSGIKSTKSGHLIFGNTIENITAATASEYGIYMDGDSVVVKGNTISNCADYGILLISNDDVVVADNTVADCGVGFRAQTSATDVRVQHNTFDGTAADMQIDGASTTVTGGYNTLINDDAATESNSGTYTGEVDDFAESLLAPKASPTFTGTVTMPTGLTGRPYFTAGVVSVEASDTTGLQAALDGKQTGDAQLTTLSSPTAWVLVYSGATDYAELAMAATGNALISGGTAAAPSWGKIDLTSHVSGILAGTNGGTNNAFFEVTGPTTATKTFTFPDASATVLTTNAAVTETQGGTGQTTYTEGDILYSDGANSLAKLGVGGAGDRLQGGTTPSWQPSDTVGLATALAGKQASDADLTALAQPSNWVTFYTNGSGTQTELALGTAGYHLRSGGPAAAPSWQPSDTVGLQSDLDGKVDESMVFGMFDSGVMDSVATTDTVWLGRVAAVSGTIDSIVFDCSGTVNLSVRIEQCDSLAETGAGIILVDAADVDFSRDSETTITAPTLNAGELLRMVFTDVTTEPKTFVCTIYAHY